MNIAILSDIHSNYVALDTCLKYLQKEDIDGYVFLGDYLAEMPYPHKTMELLYKIKETSTCYFIRGNKEDYWLDYRERSEDWWEKGSTGALLYTYERLTEREFEFFSTMPVVQELTFDDLPPVTICHASPYKNTEGLRPGEERTWQVLEEIPTSILVCGHTHLQYKVEHNGKRLFNSGAVGVPCRSGGKMQFMILHGEDGTWKEEFVSLAYDTRRVISEVMNSELYQYSPNWCKITANLLEKGEPPHSEVLMEAMRFCEEATGEAVWHSIPDKYWEMAIKNMIK